MAHEIAGHGIAEDIAPNRYGLGRIKTQCLLDPAPEGGGAGQRRPHVDGLQPGQLIKAGINRRRYGQQQGLPVKGFPAAPFTAKSAPRGGHRIVDIGGSTP